MNTSLKIARIWGIPIGLHISWFLIFILLTWSLSTSYFPLEYPKLGVSAYVALAAVTSILFFGSVLAHELGHSIIALRNQIPVKNITLFIFGGVAQIEREPRTPGAEFRIAIAGPIVSLVLGLIFGGLWLLDQAVPYLAAPSLYLMRINLILAFFNLIPGFPLDGGRVLRAIAWQITGSYPRATRFATTSGQIVAFGFIAIGVYAMFNQLFMNGLWLVFIGWFLQNAAAVTAAQLRLQEALKGVTVQQAMTTDCTQIPGLMPVSELVEDHVLTGGHRCFYISDPNGLAGMVTLRDITQLPKPKWRFTTAGQIMVPLDRVVHVSPQTELITALHIMDNANVAQVPVLEAGRLVGTLTREQIIHYLRLRTELGI
jgi:Zn-dependent protease